MRWFALSPKRAPFFIASTVFLLWVIGIIFAFWWFELRLLSSFVNKHTHFQGDLVPDYLSVYDSNDELLAEIDFDRVVVAHILDPNCPCTRFSEKHVDDLERRFSSTVHFIRWEQLPKALRRQANIPTSPAVAVWNRNGYLAYFGPYSDGAFCGQGDDLVTSVLNQLKTSQGFRWVNQDALGCFCDWPYSV